MVLIQAGGHPRKPGWSRYRCDDCGETFWGGFRHPLPPGFASDRCADCLREPHTVHFVGRPDSLLRSVDEDPDAYQPDAREE